MPVVISFLRDVHWHCDLLLTAVRLHDNKMNRELWLPAVVVADAALAQKQEPAL